MHISFKQFLSSNVIKIIVRDLGASQISELGNFYNKEKEEEIALPNLK